MLEHVLILKKPGPNGKGKKTQWSFEGEYIGYTNFQGLLFNLLRFESSLISGNGAFINNIPRVYWAVLGIGRWDLSYLQRQPPAFHKMNAKNSGLKISRNE